MTHTASTVPYLACSGLFSQGLIHGFLGKDFVLAPSHSDTLCQAFSDSFDAPLSLLHQVHGSECVNVCEQHSTNEEFFEADAFLFPRFSSEPRAYGIKTADCVPILLVGKTTCAVIHAGWRGLAAGILKRVSAQLAQHDDLSSVTALIGPAAGGDHYEVGREVLEEIGPCVSYRQISESKALLDLEHTAEKLLVDSGIEQVFASGICTMSDDRFYSYRREGQRAGRNLAFILQERTIRRE